MTPIIGTRADFRPSDYRWQREQSRRTRDMEWEHRHAPYRGYGRDLAKGIILGLGFVALSIAAMWALGPFAAGFWALVEMVRGG